VTSRTPNVERPRIPPRPTPAEAGADARERIVRTAYELFTRHGLAAVGVDRIVDEADVAKTTLYRHFRSKDDLIVAVLERHRQLWLRDWLEPKLAGGDTSAAERLLAVFDSFEEWFGDDSFNGCLFINSLGETRDRASAVRLAAIGAIEDVYVLLAQLTVEARAREPELLARQIQLLMRGTIVAATEGHANAVHEARDAARQLVERALPHRSPS
jgi:AcrR family transcriptional regulator